MGFRHRRQRSNHWFRRFGFPREVLLELLKASTWKRHPAPFAKTTRGRDRRSERRFVISQKWAEEL